MNENIVALIEEEGLILAVAHPVTGKLCLPGGKVRAGEMLVDALERACDDLVGIRVRSRGGSYVEHLNEVPTYAVPCTYSEEVECGKWVTREELEGEAAHTPEFNRNALAWWDMRKAFIEAS